VTPRPPFSARDTEATDTPASRATSLMVAAGIGDPIREQGTALRRQRKRFHGGL
jgi:hypothetical protein